MSQKIFIGVTFQDDYLTRKVDDFRKRFDPKFSQNKTLHMSLFAPFYIDDKNFKSLLEDLNDEIDNHFFDREHYQISFCGIDSLNYKKQEILHLRPYLEDDVNFCIEGLQQLVEDYGHRPTQKKGRSFLTLGRFKDFFSIQMGIEAASTEFQLPIELAIASISVFVKTGDTWTEKYRLKTFEKQQLNPFLQTASTVI